MAHTPFYEQVEISYAITENLSVDLVEICNWRPDFPACEYCGDNEYWNIVWATGYATICTGGKVWTPVADLNQINRQIFGDRIAEFNVFIKRSVCHTCVRCVSGSVWDCQ